MEQVKREAEVAAELREAYLADVSRRMSNGLTPWQVYESIREIRGHLDSMAFANEQEGMDPAAAMKASIIHFGPSDKIGRGIAESGGAPSGGVGLLLTVVATSFLILISESGPLVMRSFQWRSLCVLFLVAVGNGAVTGALAWFLRLTPIRSGLWAALVSSAFNLTFIVISYTGNPASFRLAGLSILASLPSGILFGFAVGVVAGVIAQRVRTLRPHSPRLARR